MPQIKCIYLYAGKYKILLLEVSWFGTRERNRLNLVNKTRKVDNFTENLSPRNLRVLFTKYLNKTDSDIVI